MNFGKYTVSLEGRFLNTIFLDLYAQTWQASYESNNLFISDIYLKFISSTSAFIYCMTLSTALCRSRPCLLITAFIFWEFLFKSFLWIGILDITIFTISQYFGEKWFSSCKSLQGSFLFFECFKNIDFKVFFMIKWGNRKSTDWTVTLFTMKCTYRNRSSFFEKHYFVLKIHLKHVPQQRTYTHSRDKCHNAKGHWSLTEVTPKNILLTAVGVHGKAKERNYILKKEIWNLIFNLNNITCFLYQIYCYDVKVLILYR